MKNHGPSHKIYRNIDKNISVCVFFSHSYFSLRCPFFLFLPFTNMELKRISLSTMNTKTLEVWIALGVFLVEPQRHICHLSFVFIIFKAFLMKNVYPPKIYTS